MSHQQSRTHAKTATLPQPKKKKQPARKSTSTMDPYSDEFAYQVAVLAWRNGLTANAIVRKMDLEVTPLHLMQVKRALLRAAKLDFLVLRPPRNQDLEEKLTRRLRERCPTGHLQLHVVQETHEPTTGPVFARAAEVALDIIKQIANTKAPQRRSGDPATEENQVIVCNAGGRTVAETTRVFLRHPPLLDSSDQEAERLKSRLLFVAANAAYRPRHFNLSANFLAVTMAQVFDAEHFALPREENANILLEHKRLVSRADLFICGAGSRHSGLMAQILNEINCEMPPEAVGDLAFNLLDKNGDHVPMFSEEARKLLGRINPSLDLLCLKGIADSGRVLLILDAQYDERGRVDQGKAAIAAAALKRRIATDIVLGEHLAEEIYKIY